MLLYFFCMLFCLMLKQNKNIVFILSYFMMCVPLFMSSYCGIFMFPNCSHFISLSFMSGVVIGLVLSTENKKYIYFLSVLLLLSCISFFMAMNVFILLITYELVLFPVILLLLSGGSQIEKIKAGYYLFVYLFMFSLVFIVCLFGLEAWSSNAYLNMLLSVEMKWGIMCMFLVKVPLFGLHTWLPSVHVESPTCGSVVLAGVLLKLSLGGFLRMAYMFRFHFNFLLILLSVVGLSLGTLICSYQSDAKALVAYSSVSHMNFMLLNFVILVVLNTESSVLLSLDHGFTSSIIFFYTGLLVHNCNSRMVYYLSGVLVNHLGFSFLLFLIFITNCSTPPALAFIGELNMISASVNHTMVFTVVFVFYVMGVCYYTLYLLIVLFAGKNILHIAHTSLLMSGSLTFLSFNLLMLFFYL